MKMEQPPVYNARFVEPTGYSYNLSEEMLQILANEFSPEKAASGFADAIKGKSPQEVEAAGKAVFEEFGQKWIRRASELGDQYPDRTYEMIREMGDRTGEFVFPFVGQRTIEIAYMATMEKYVMPIEENNQYKLVYMVDECKIYSAVREKCGAAAADLLACRHGCLAAAQTVFTDLGKKVFVEMLAQTPKDSYCRFSITQIKN